MAELDLFRNFRRGVAAPSTDAHRRASARLARALDEATGGRAGNSRAHQRSVAADSRARCCGARRRRGRRPQPSAPCVTSLATGRRTVQRNFYPSEGKRGSFSVRIVSMSDGAGSHTREWRILPEPARSGEASVPATGQYVQVTGRGRIVRRGGHAQAWSARLVGFVTRPGEAKQRVVITMKGRPQGVFVLTPLQPGVLKRDSGTQSTRRPWVSQAASKGDDRECAPIVVESADRRADGTRRHHPTSGGVEDPVPWCMCTGLLFRRRSRERLQSNFQLRTLRPGSDDPRAPGGDGDR